jgi:hypothetical protein
MHIRAYEPSDITLACDVAQRVTGGYLVRPSRSDKPSDISVSINRAIGPGTGNSASQVRADKSADTIATLDGAGRPAVLDLTRLPERTGTARFARESIRSHQAADISLAAYESRNRTIRNRSPVACGQEPQRGIANDVRILQTKILDAPADANVSEQAKAGPLDGMDSKVSDRMVISIEPARKPPTAFAVRLHGTGGNHRNRLFRHEPSGGRVLGQVDVGDQHEMPVIEIRVPTETNQLLGRGDLVRIVRLARAAREFDGPCRSAEGQRKNDRAAWSCLMMIFE